MRDVGYGPHGERVWLNTAHQGILPRVAADAAREAIAWKREPWELTEARFAGVPGRLRAALARLLDAPEDEVSLANSNSYGLHLVANGYPWRPGDEVLLVEGDFPSTIQPWLALWARGVRPRLIRPGSGVLTAEDVDAAITPETRVLATTWVHSLRGHAIDVDAIGTVCRARGVTFVLNASQAIGARRFSARSMPVDAVTSVGFKWLTGPYGTGFLWMRKDLRARLEVNRAYWLAAQTAEGLEGAPGAPVDARATEVREATDADVLPQPETARRYDVFGTANFFQFHAWAAAIEHLLEIGIDEVSRHDQSLVDRIVRGVDVTPFRVLSPREGPARSTLVFLTHEDASRNRAIYERLRAANVYVAFRAGRIRVSPHVYNDSDDVDRLIEAITRSS